MKPLATMCGVSSMVPVIQAGTRWLGDCGGRASKVIVNGRKRCNRRCAFTQGIVIPLFEVVPLLWREKTSW